MKPSSSPYRRWLLGAQLVIVLLLGAASLHAQESLIDPATAGRLYLLAFPDTMQYDTDPSWPWEHKDTFSIVLYSGTPNTVTMSGAGGWNRVVELRAGIAETVHFTEGSDMPSRVVGDVTGEVRMGEAIRVEGAEPFVVYCGMATRYGAEAWTPLPVEYWGKTYVAAAGQPKVTFQVDPFDSLDFKYLRTVDILAPGGVLVVASEAGTHVRIEPVREGLFGGTPLEVVLDVGETFQWQTPREQYVFPVPYTTFDTTPSISGTRIVADRPVGVVSYTTLADDMSLGDGWRNLVNRHNAESRVARSQDGHGSGSPTIEWLTPTQQWGTRFGVSDFERWWRRIDRSDSGYRGGVVLYAISDPTRPAGQLRSESFRRRQVGSDTFIYEDTIRTYTLGDSPGAVYKDTVLQALEFDRPIQLYAQIPYAALVPYLQAYHNDSVRLGSSPISLIPPREQWAAAAAIVALPLPEALNHIVMIVADSASRGKIVDQNGMPFAFTDTLTAHGLTVGWRALASGEALVLHGQDGARFTGVCYGFSAGWHKSIQYERPILPRQPIVNWYETPALAYAYPLASRHANLDLQGASPRQRDVPRGNILSVDPRSGVVRFVAGNGVSGVVRFNVYTAIGEHLLSFEGQQVAENVWEGRMSFDNQADGIYFITAEMDNTMTATVRVVQSSQ